MIQSMFTVAADRKQVQVMKHFIYLYAKSVTDNTVKIFILITVTFRSAVVVFPKETTYACVRDCVRELLCPICSFWMLPKSHIFELASILQSNIRSHNHKFISEQTRQVKAPMCLIQSPTDQAKTQQLT